VGNNGLAALMGIFKGTEELPDGLIAGDRQRLAEQQASELTAHRKTLEDQAYLDLPPVLSTALGLPAGRNRKELLPVAATVYEKDAARQYDAQKNAALDKGLADLETRQVPGSPGDLEGGAYPSSVQTDPQMTMLRKLLPALGHDKVTPIITELVKERAAGNTDLGVPHITQDGTNVIRTDKKTGAFKDVTPTGLERTEAKGPFQRSDIERALAEHGWSKDMPGYATEYANVAKQVSVPGVGIYGGGQIIVNAPGKPGAPAAAPPNDPTKPRLAAETALPGAQVDSLADLRSLQQQLNAVQQKFKPEYVGPIAGGLGGYLREKSGRLIDQPEGEFRAAMQSFWNILGQVRSGKVLTGNEMTRLEAELPSASAAPQIFAAKMANARELLARMLANKEAEFKARGYRGGAPAGAASNGGETLSRRDPLYQKARQRGMSDQQIQQKYGLAVTD
jgi:hypothetical protein